MQTLLKSIKEPFLCHPHIFTWFQLKMKRKQCLRSVVWRMFWMRLPLVSRFWSRACLFPGECLNTSSHCTRRPQLWSLYISPIMLTPYKLLACYLHSLLWIIKCNFKSLSATRNLAECKIMWETEHKCSSLLRSCCVNSENLEKKIYINNIYPVLWQLCPHQNSRMTQFKAFRAILGWVWLLITCLMCTKNNGHFNHVSHLWRSVPKTRPVFKEAWAVMNPDWHLNKGERSKFRRLFPHLSKLRVPFLESEVKLQLWVWHFLCIGKVQAESLFNP